MDLLEHLWVHEAIARVGQAVRGRQLAAGLLLLHLGTHPVVLIHSLLNFSELLGAASLAEFGLEAIDAVFKDDDVFDELLVDFHHADAVAVVLGLLLLKLVVEGVNGLLEEGHLDLVLLLDLAVFNGDSLAVVVFNVALQLVKHADLEFLIIVNVLGYPVDVILERTNQRFLLADL